MNNIIHLGRSILLTLLPLNSFVALSLAQEVSIPDPVLKAAIWQALGLPAGSLTVQDMLSLTKVDLSGVRAGFAILFCCICLR
jgi:hypothetical protein